MQLPLFGPGAEIDSGAGFALVDLFEAYYSCRRNKRGTLNALAFEVDFESHLVELWQQINDGIYRPGPSVAFIVNRPVKREIFAADFRDRVVHHLIVNKVNPLFEREFIHDSYACRPGRGTLFGIHRLDRFIRRCSQGYTRPCYVLKLDIRGFFMHINTRILLNNLREFLIANYSGGDLGRLVDLCEIVVGHRAAAHCVIKGSRSDWRGLPADKSLFHSPPGCGLPIGNLSSQVFANFYLNGFDHFVKHDLGVRFYGRYVDDMVFVHRDRAHLAGLIPVLSSYLAKELALEIHPRKIFLQPHGHGVPFLGAVIKPNRIYIGSRTKGSFFDALTGHNAIIADHFPTVLEQQQLVASVNSYLGIMGHFRTRRLRQQMLGRHLGPWWGYVFAGSRANKIMLKKRSREPGWV